MKLHLNVVHQMHFPQYVYFLDVTDNYVPDRLNSLSLSFAFVVVEVALRHIANSEKSR